MADAEEMQALAMREEVRDEIEVLRGRIEVVRGEIEAVRGQIEVVRGRIEVVSGEIEAVRGQIEVVRQQLEGAGEENEPEIEDGPKNLQETKEELQGNLDRLEEILNDGEDIPEGEIVQWLGKLMELRRIQRNRQDIQIQVNAEYGGVMENVRLLLENDSLTEKNRELQLKLEAAGRTGLDKLPVWYFACACFSFIVAALLICWTISDFGPASQPGTFIDGLYVASSIMLSIGFGDITPVRPLVMFLCDGLALFGPVIVFILAHFLSRYAHDLELRVLPQEEYRRTRYRVSAAIITILLTIVLGMIGIYFFEWMLLGDRSPSPSPSRSPSLWPPSSPSLSLSPSPSPPGILPVDASWVLFADIFHLSVMMMTTTGFGDFAFTTPSGRVFAILWMPLSTTLLAVASEMLIQTFFIYLTHRSTRDYILLPTTDD